MAAANPILANVSRGNAIESIHRGSLVVCDTKGKIIIALGDTERPVFSRSSVKAFQCLPLIESGAADKFNLTDEEIALCCGSHNGEDEHRRVAKSILEKAGNNEEMYECGAHWPCLNTKPVPGMDKPTCIMNNCSGKHAGMLALARHLGAPLQGYVSLDHPVQQAIAKSMSALCDFDVSTSPVGVDGCSVPTWTMPLKNLALGFARFTDPSHAAGQRMIRAAREHPFMISGTDRFDTRAMKAVPRLFLKVGAEGFYCGAVPHAGLGFALKIDDGAFRACEVAVAGAMLALDCWTAEERKALQELARQDMKNWRGILTGTVASHVAEALGGHTGVWA